MANAPSAIVIGGPNGAGKSTVAPSLVRSAFGPLEFVNADVIASGLSGLHPDRQAFSAGRIMLRHIRTLARNKSDFAFESTLASRTFAPFLRRLVADGYQVHLVYVWLRSPEVAIDRVRARVAAGGHAVPMDTIRRRYHRSLQNLFTLYMPVATTWALFDNSDQTGPKRIASGGVNEDTMIHDTQHWSAMRQHDER